MPQVQIQEAPYPTTKHKSAESCLSTGRACPCKIEEFLYNMILFVKPPPDLECMCLMPLGDDFFCASPMRSEIYECCGT